eukprot:229540-Rhodomonas_salina.1
MEVLSVQSSCLDWHVCSVEMHAAGLMMVLRHGGAGVVTLERGVSGALAVRGEATGNEAPPDL